MDAQQLQALVQQLMAIASELRHIRAAINKLADKPWLLITGLSGDINGNTLLVPRGGKFYLSEV